MDSKLCVQGPLMLPCKFDSRFYLALANWSYFKVMEERKGRKFYVQLIVS